MNARKNLIVIHMESLSSILFFHHRTDMPVLWKLMQKSMQFNSFFSSSTSTFMSLVDFMHGDSSELDHHMIYPTEAGCLLGRSSNLFCDLLQRGYEARCIRYGTFRDYAADDVDNYLGLAPGSGIVTSWHSDHDDYCRAMQAFFKERNPDKPFALHLLNLITHVRDKCPEKIRESGINATFTAAYRLLDRSVGILLDELDKAGLMADTVIAAFGDHGNELWYHGLGKGFMHSTEPYASLCSVPLFVFAPETGSGMSDALISMVDLKSTLSHILFPSAPPAKRETPFAGVNVFSEARSLAFSQNLLALQLEQQDPSRGLLKSYAVTDGMHRLVATSGGDRRKWGGLEFFCDRMDPDNSTNFLEFMHLDKKGEVLSFDFHGARHPHFIVTMTRPMVTALMRKFNELKQVLHEYIRAKENLALPHLIGNRYSLFPGQVFTQARKRRGWSV